MQTTEAQSLAALIHLGRRAREAKGLDELNFVAVNETHGLTPYRQAALWLRDGVQALSGVAEVEANAPYVQWLNQLLERVVREQNSDDPLALGPEELGADLEEWSQWLPSAGLWLPLPSNGRFAGGGLLLARDTPWSGAELALLKEWASIYTQARTLLQPPPLVLRLWNGLLGNFKKSATPAGPVSPLRIRRLFLLLVILGTLILPVQLSVLAPAELVPLNPAVIRAPLDGVVEHVLVEPNQRVVADQPLFEFDRVSIRNRLQVAIQAMATVEAEYRLRAQQAVFDPKSKSKLAVLQGQIAEKKTEVDFLRQLDARGLVLAPRAGLVLFDDPTEWVGRPVVTGERVMVVADAHQVEIEAWLSPADLIPLAPDAGLKLYLNADPLHSLAGNLRYLAHEASQRPEGHYAYRLRARLMAEGAKPRVGLKGTAKLEGDSVPLAYWMLRRPLAAARTWLGI